MIIRRGTQEDAEGFIFLLQYAWQQMKHPEWLYLDDSDDVRKRISDGTMKLWVAMDEDRMAAAFDILIPGLDSFNYGYDLEFSEAELLQTVNMDTIVVHPEYRGQGLQRILMKEAELWAVEQGYQTLMCTVHPDNCFSLNNMLKLGYRIEKTLPKYGSVRHVLRKPLFKK